ncbi:MAG: transglycosylase domain-containing protein [Synechococcus sp. ELA057]
MAETALEISQPGQETRRIVLHPGCYRIGRDSTAEVVLPHGAISRRHALLELRGGHWLLQDDQSTNGLWWKGRRIQQLLLRDGDRVRFGPDEQQDLPEIRFRAPGASRRRRLLRAGALALAAAAGGGLLLLLVGAVQQPVRSQLSSLRGPLLLFDRNGQPIASVNDQSRRELASLDGYAPVLIDALLASEDSRFWWHPGVDPIGTGRALLSNLVGGRVREGGSTLTQQLARSLYPEQVGQGETLGRKWRELLVALQLEARFSKRDLLLSYLNNVYLGAGWGFESASRRLFGRSAADLKLEEAALLVGLLPSPNSYDPCLDPQAALDARNTVLAKMEDNGRLSAEQARAARRRPIQLAPAACRPSKRRALPFYSDQVRRDLERTVGPDVASEGNFLLDTYLDPNLQELVERLLRQQIDASRPLGVSEGAVVVLDSRTNGILALAGGRDYRQSQFNRATMALRQPGSTFKLITYLLALEQGAKPEDAIRCDGLDWMGQHFASGCGGSISLRQALAISSNTAALRLARRVGLESIVRKARELGITTPLNPVPGLALGQSEVTLLELTAAYGAVASDGLWRAPTTIRQLTDAEVCRGSNAGSCNRQSGASKGSKASSDAATPLAPGRRVMKASTAKTLQSMFASVVRSGTGTAASLGGGEWGKTGTTNDGRDLLFIGVEPKRHWVIGIWLGNDDNRPTQSSSALAASLWAEIVRSSSPSS